MLFRISASSFLYVLPSDPFNWRLHRFSLGRPVFKVGTLPLCYGPPPSIINMSLTWVVHCKDYWRTVLHYHRAVCILCQSQISYCIHNTADGNISLWQQITFIFRSSKNRSPSSSSVGSTHSKVHSRLKVISRNSCGDMFSFPSSFALHRFLFNCTLQHWLKTAKAGNVLLLQYRNRSRSGIGKGDSGSNLFYLYIQPQRYFFLCRMCLRG